MTAIGNPRSSNDELQKDKGLIEFKTLHELQKKACLTFSENQLYGTYNPVSGQFEYIKYEDFGRMVQECCAVLKNLGVNQYDKIGIISNNSAEWAMLASAAYSLNATLVPLYEAQRSTDWTYILNDSSATVVFCSTKDIFDRFSKEVLPYTPQVHSNLCFGAIDGEEYGYQTVLGRIHDDISFEHASMQAQTSPSEEDLANIIYTSGTTGKPKGVELTHRNVVSNVKGGRLVSRNPFDLLDESDRSLAFLPWAHSYGQTCELWMGMSFGSSCAICRGVPFLLEDLQLVQPTVLFAVPTLYKKIFDGVQNKMKSGNYVQDTLLTNAIQIGNKQAQFQRGEHGALSYFEQFKFSLLDRLVLSKVRDRFGGKLRYGCVAGAACPTEVLSFMDAIGISVLEGYGLTETSPIITLNSPEQRSIGSVGKPIPGVTVFIIDENGNPLPVGEEGEICCVGPNVMRGYHKNKKATEEVITTAPDGKSRMFRTGDLGKVLNEEGWLHVTGRIKEQYKLENGKYVVPTPIEDAIGMSRFISQVVLCGANRPHNVALLVPEWAAIRQEFDFKDNIPDITIVNDERVKKMIDNEILEKCTSFKKFEIPKDWAIVSPFTAANNMLTPKMSLRKHKIIEAYHDLISNLYGDNQIVPDGISESEEAA